MRIVYLAAGAAGMYCGSCLHDNTLAAGLLELGADALLVPTYTPLRTDEPNVSLRRVFYGGINVYLQQKSAVFRHTPQCVDRLLDSPALIERVASGRLGTDASQLGPLTVSMLKGETGHQRKELHKLLGWLKREARPSIVHLSNALLLGAAPALRKHLDVPVVATLSGEDIFLEKLPEPHYSSARRLLRENAVQISAFVALNHYYADFMAEYLNVARDRIEVIPHGLRLEGHGRGAEDPSAPLTIGYFARVCHDKGLHLLVEALGLLAKNQQLPPWRAKAAGYLGAGDRAYLAKVRRRAVELGLTERFHYLGELDRVGKIEFLQSLHCLSVPTIYRESKGISVLEAMANGVPVVVPAHGTFPELLEDTGGGMLCEPHNPHDLAAKLAHLLVNHQLRRELGRRGQAAMFDRYHHRAMAQRHLELYQRFVSSRSGAEQSLPSSI
jgi:glycosyltransferase involved in cell wall biosynthesis